MAASSLSLRLPATLAPGFRSKTSSSRPSSSCRLALGRPAGAAPAGAVAAKGIQQQRRRRQVMCSVTSSPNMKEMFTAALTKLSNAETKEEFFGVINVAKDAAVISEQVASGFSEFFDSYGKAVKESNVDDPEKVTVRVMAMVAGKTLEQFVQPYEFEPFHEAIREPYDYYQFGQTYVSQLINFEKSLVASMDMLEKIDQQLKDGDNVVLMANHQTEADPAVWALLIEAKFPEMARNLIYIAGGRVTEDPMCRPFSMGRNLICVHSRKRMDDNPETKEVKMAANRKALSVMKNKMKDGSRLLWVAPSGGRDRPDENDRYLPAPLDSGAIDTICTILTAARVPFHVHPMAMISYGIMPPPSGRQKSLGERRICNYSPVGIKIGEELELPKGRDMAAPLIFEGITENYKQLEEAMKQENIDPAGQPWKA